MSPYFAVNDRGSRLLRTAARVANRRPLGALARALKKGNPISNPKPIIEELYLAVLCRLPRPDEIALMQRHFSASANRLQAAQDAMWVLLNSKEFLFNH